MKCPSCKSEISGDSRFCSKCGSAVHAAGEGEAAFTKTLTTPRPGWASGSLLAGKYRIREEIGHGGMGIVYRAEDIKLGRPVALKFLPPEWTRDKNARERFIQEARAAAALAHPNICTVYEVDDSEERPFIAMEYVEGETIREKTRRGPLPLEEALALVSQAAEGLEAAHCEGVVHRDIKSSNIMVTNKGQAKIMDFGLAKLRGGSSLTGEGATIGTVAYMSPEQARGEKVDYRTDIWSLGVVLYEMVSGELPFRGERDVSLLYAIVHEGPHSLKEKKPPVPPDLQRVIGQALDKDPDSRYQTAAEMRRDIVKYQDVLKTESGGVINVHNFLKKLRRPVVAIPCAVGILAIASLAFWFINRQAKIRWARNVVLPKINELIEAGAGLRDNAEIYRLAADAERYIPQDTQLAAAFDKISKPLTIITEPAGANVYAREYQDPDGEWDYLGVTPIENRRMPIEYLRFKMEKEGFESVLGADASVGYDSKTNKVVPGRILRKLDKLGAIPPGMVRVSGGEYTENVKVGDFFIDRNEVTNRQYKEFVDNGGYRNKEPWKNRFVKDGKELGWDEAVAGFVDSTGRPGPATWQGGDYPEGQDDYPVSGVSWFEAAAYAEFAGKSLPTGAHFGIARGGLTLLITSKGFAEFFTPQSNFGGKGPERVGSRPAITACGAYDMGGNVREWCSNETKAGRLVRGGAWNDIPYMFGNWSQASPFDRSPKNGFRCVVYIHPEEIPKSCFDPVEVEESRDLYKLKPVPDAVFQVYKEQYSYDKSDLNARVEARDDTSKDWIKEKISLAAAYDNERLLAYLFLPKSALPPYQTVVYFPGSGAAMERSSEHIETSGDFGWLTPLIKSGRAVIFPVYKATFERGSDELLEIHSGADSRQYTELFIKMVKDLKRSIDYLETRPEVDIKNLAYLGFSWGGKFGAIIPAIEDRLKVGILVVGGIWGGVRPEVDEINYVTRVKIPMLMLNGRYDMTFIYEVEVKPMFDLLGTPKDRKELILYETDHFIPKNEYIKESLRWLDRYFGPVK